MSREIWTIRRVLEWTRGYLGEKGIENARLEAEWLVAHALSTNRIGVYMHYDKPLHQDELAKVKGLIARRARREPLQYILGTQEFMGFDFEVAPGVLIPRHDTEVLVTETLKRVTDGARILDIGSGSGCVAIAIAKKLSAAQLVSVDVSPEALTVARRNAERLDAAVSFLEGTLFEPVHGQRFDAVVSNPPYIPTADLAALQPEVRDFEPKSALDGGNDGLDFYRRIIPGSKEHLCNGGWCIVELGIGQAPAVAALFAAEGFTDIFTAPDTAGIDRVVGGRFA